MRRRVGLLALAVAPLVVAACGGGRGGPSVSPCFRVLPEAHAAVSGQGAFVDVARIRGPRTDVFPGAAGPTAPASTAPPSSAPTGAASPGDTRRDVCLVAYRGTFDPARIPLLRGPRRQGGYAVVVVGVRTQRVRGVFLADQLPAPLRRH